jgi:hypothetical protein
MGTNEHEFNSHPRAFVHLDSARDPLPLLCVLCANLCVLCVELSFERR